MFYEIENMEEDFKDRRSCEIEQDFKDRRSCEIEELGPRRLAA